MLWDGVFKLPKKSHKPFLFFICSNTNDSIGLFTSPTTLCSHKCCVCHILWSFHRWLWCVLYQRLFLWHFHIIFICNASHPMCCKIKKPCPSRKWKTILIKLEFHHCHPSLTHSKMYVGANKIQWANMITLKEDYMSFSQKKTFFIRMNFGTIFLQFVTINAYSCPNTWHAFCLSFLNKCENLKVFWFLVNSTFCLEK